MPSGGVRAGAGRKKGRAPKPVYVPNPEEQMPLDLMLEVMRNPKYPMPLRLAEAHQAAKYCHATILSADLTVDAELIIQLVSQCDGSQLDNDPPAQP